MSATGGFCANCGTQLAEGATFCAKCGTAVQPGGVPPTPVAAAPPPKRRGRKRLLALIAIPLLLCIGIVATQSKSSGGGSTVATATQGGTTVAAAASQPTATTAQAKAVPTEKPAAPTPTPKPAPSAAPATVGKIGDTVTVKTFSLTVHAKKDPATGAIPAGSGKRYVAYDVTITAIGNDISYNPLYAKLKMADNTEANIGFGGPDPSLQSGKLAAGESARGWLAFEIAADAQPATLSYEILVLGSSGGKPVFDVR